MTANTLPKKVWLAGLGALARAEKEGDQWLDELMADGERYETEKAEEITLAFQEITEKVKTGRSRARQGLSNIEHSFESKVSNTLSKVGLVSKNELNELLKRVQVLESELKEQTQDATP